MASLETVLRVLKPGELRWLHTADPPQTVIEIYKLLAKYKITLVSFEEGLLNYVFRFRGSTYLMVTKTSAPVGPSDS
jgi:hypothetical protein